MNGLVLPHFSQLDPDTLGEGNLDPLGLAGIADELANRIAPHVTARMARIRFVTAMAVGGVVTERLVDEIAIDGQTTAELAFEWHVVEAFARAKNAPESALARVPGIGKARRAIAAKQRLNRDRYLKTPKVFGFNGVYKRLAASFDVVNDDLSLSDRGYELVAAWEQRHKLPGFADRRPGSPGGTLAAALERAVLLALEHGSVKVGAGKVSPLFDLLRPDRARGSERKLLWQWLTSDEVEERRELIACLARLDDWTDEHDALRAVRHAHPRISHDLGSRLDAIEAYERVALLLSGVLEALRYESWRNGSRPTSSSHAATNLLVQEAANSLPLAMEEAERRLDSQGLGERLHDQLGTFSHHAKPAELVELCLEHHERVQRAKPPNGKRPWFDRRPGGFFVRLGYELAEEPEPPAGYIHPYRVRAMTQFIEDLS